MQFKQKARIDRWCVVPKPGAEDPRILVLMGQIVDHPASNGCGVTSDLLWYSASFRMAETKNTFYELGEPDPSWVKQLEAEGHTISSLEPTIP